MGARLTVQMHICLGAPALDQFDALVGWVCHVASSEARVLDIGAGDGDMAYPSRVRTNVGAVIGVDPSPLIHKNRRLDEAYEMSVERFSLDHREQFDVAVASYVAEHIESPIEFLNAVYACLKPGGSAFVLTPSAKHYFGAVALVSKRVGLSERLVRRLRPAVTIEEYHFPIAYRMNTTGRLRSFAETVGFRAMEVVMIEDPGVFLPYFPSLLSPLPHAYARFVHWSGRPNFAGTMLCRLVK